MIPDKRENSSEIIRKRDSSCIFLQKELRFLGLWGYKFQLSLDDEAHPPYYFHFFFYQPKIFTQESRWVNAYSLLNTKMKMEVPK
jgi:hypothetical protein